MKGKKNKRRPRLPFPPRRDLRPERCGPGAPGRRAPRTHVDEALALLGGLRDSLLATAGFGGDLV
jgi:hypothetical protein